MFHLHFPILRARTAWTILARYLNHSPIGSIASIMESTSFYSSDSSDSLPPFVDSRVPIKRKLSELYPNEQPCTLLPPAKRVKVDDDPSLPRVQMTCMKLFLLAA